LRNEKLIEAVANLSVCAIRTNLRERRFTPPTEVAAPAIACIGICPGFFHQSIFSINARRLSSETKKIGKWKTENGKGKV
jgi:hypothetical protein